MFLCDNHWGFWTFFTLTLKKVLWKTKAFLKKHEYHFLVQNTMNESATLPCKIVLSKDNPMGTPRRIHVDSTWILRGYVKDQISTNFHVISAYLFDVISMVEKSTWFPRTFFDVISLVEKFTWFPRTFFDVISMVEKSTWFPRTFFYVTSMVEKSTWFPRTFFVVISMVEKPTLFPRTFICAISMVEICTLFSLTFFDVTLMGKDLASFLVSCKIMKTFEKLFPVFVTLNSWLLQDCSL